jgi:glutathione S-transferase
MTEQPPLSDPARPDAMIMASFALCPYVQRAAIVALEKALAFERVVVDLANKPDWFVKRSPTGKVPLLMMGEITLFESAAIAEFLDEISGGGMLPEDAIERARHRAWIEFASGTLAEIAALYNAADEAAFDARAEALKLRFGRVSQALQGPWFGGETFGLVDAAFAPVFRYLDTFERDADLFLLAGDAGLEQWRGRLAERASVSKAAVPDYAERLRAFLLARNSFISRLIDRVMRAPRRNAA